MDFGQQNGTSVSWLVNQQASKAQTICCRFFRSQNIDTALGLTLRDSIGQVAQSASFTVNPGCMYIMISWPTEIFSRIG